MIRSIRSYVRGGIRGGLAAAALLMLASGGALLAQQSEDADTTALGSFEPVRPSYYVGLFAGLGLIHHEANISPRVFSRNGTFPADANYRAGDGLGLAGGLLFELPLSTFLSVGIRAGYQDRSAPLVQQYTNSADVRAIDTSRQGGTVEGRLESTLPYINGTPYLKITPLSFPLYAMIGPTVLVPLGPSYTVNETVLSPRGAVFRSNGKTTRRLAGGDMTSAATVFGMTAGVGVDLALSDRLGLFVEGNFSPTFSDVMPVSGGSWTTSALSALVGFRLGLGGQAEEPVVAPPPVRPRDTTQVAVRADSAFRAGAVTPGGLADTLTIAPRRVRATEVHALLPYVFFARDSAVIPARYVQFDRKTRTGFQLERIQRGSTLGVYYQLLNVIGQRMRDNRRAKLTITGCTSDREQGDTALSRRRAEAVRDYLVNVWRVRDNRINVVARLLPANPSLSEVEPAEGALENQRVEITSDDYAVVAPVMLPDTSILEPAGTIRFLPSANDTTRAAEYWSLDVKIGDSLVRDAVTGTGPVPAQIDYPIETRPDLDIRTPVEVSSTLVIRDTSYAELAQVRSERVVVRQQGRFEEEREVVNGRYLDRYNLLLFSFDSAGVFDFSQQATAIMQNRITQNSVVRVYGHTDRIGLPTYNKQLSQRRAEVAASLLGVQPKEVVGMGEKNLLYDNQFPEGRYYCRTVTVEIETPTSMASQPRDAGPLNAKRGGAERSE